MAGKLGSEVAPDTESYWLKAYDKVVISEMVVNHQQAVAMSELVPSKTRHPELVNLNQDIIKTQSTEIS